MGVFEAIILGIVQGATEFLPVSSTGHLILMRSFLEVSDSHALAFDAVLHLATAAAVIVYFRRDIISLLQTLLRMMGRLPVDAKNQTLLTALIVGTIPAVVLGLLLESYMESVFRNPILVAVVLVLGSVFFMVAEFLYKGGRQKKTIERTVDGADRSRSVTGTHSGNVTVRCDNRRRYDAWTFTC